MSQCLGNTPIKSNDTQFSNSYVRHGIFVSILAISLMLGESMFVLGHAQTLGQRPGQSELQSATGTGVQGVCPQLGGLTSRNSEQDDLFTNCRALVQTGNELNGVTGPGITFSLGLTNEELNSAIQQVAGEEVVAPRTMASKTFNGQQKNLSARLSALRAGVKGFSVSGLGFGGFQKFAELDSADYGRLGVPQRGGGASGDGTRFNRLSAFINGIISTGEKDETSQEDGFDFDSQGVTLGVDYRLLDDLVLGTAFSYSHFDADFNSSSVNSGGDSKSDGYVFSLYGTYYVNNFYVEGIGSAGWNDHDSKRVINFGGLNRTAKGDTHSTQFSFSVGVGYDFLVKSVDFGPYARLSYLRVDIDGFNESGAQGLNLQIEDQDITSVISALGVRASKKFSWKWGVWFPQIRGEWDHEYENDSKTINTQYVSDPFNTQLFVRTESPDRNFFRVGATLANVSQGGTQAFFDFETMLGFRDITNHIFTLGVRQEF